MGLKLYFTILIFFIVTTNLLSNELDYPTWLENFKIRAEKHGISKEIIDETLSQVKIIPRVIELDRKQPEFTLTLSQYLNRVISKQRKKKGISKIRENWVLLENISKKYNVQPRFIVALWGIETDFGRISGGFPVIDSLVTLAYDGRRGEYFSKELLNALKIIDEGHISYDKMIGSWAGAMGQVQFLPTTFLESAVDFDKDGKKDIWGSEIDVFASIANYLTSLEKAPWDNNYSWGFEVEPPQNIDSLYDSLKQENPKGCYAVKTMSKEKPFYKWIELGFKFNENEIFIENAIRKKNIFIENDGKEKLDFTFIDDIVKLLSESAPVTVPPEVNIPSTLFNVILL